MTLVSVLLTVHLKLSNCPDTREGNDSWGMSNSSYCSMLDHDSDNDIVTDHETIALQVCDAPITYIPEHSAKDKEWVGEGDNGFVEFVTGLSGIVKDDFEAD
jgi:hypothetical protein